MPSRSVRIALGAVTGAALAVSAVVSVSAHEHRTVAGYSVLVGWRDEPTFTGVRNAIQVFINDAKGNPSDDLGDSLKLWLIYKDNTSAPQALQPAFDPDTGMGTQGEYDVAIVPMKAGNLHLPFTGRSAVRRSTRSSPPRTRPSRTWTTRHSSSSRGPREGPEAGRADEDGWCRRNRRRSPGPSPRGRRVCPQVPAASAVARHPGDRGGRPALPWPTGRVSARRSGAPPPSAR